MTRGRWSTQTCTHACSVGNVMQYDSLAGAVIAALHPSRFWPSGCAVWNPHSTAFWPDDPTLPVTPHYLDRQSGGKLPLFVDGIRALASGLSAGDRVLIAEACNHNRITDHCNDIGMVQIPRALERMCGKGLALEHAFGRWGVCGRCLVTAGVGCGRGASGDFPYCCSSGRGRRSIIFRGIRGSMRLLCAPGCQTATDQQQTNPLPC